MLCVSELADDVGDASEHESSDWTHLLDRSGGLQYVNDMTYIPTPAVDRSKSTSTGVALRRSNRKGQNSEEIK